MSLLVYLHKTLGHKLRKGNPLKNADGEAAAIKGAVQRLTTAGVTEVYCAHGAVVQFGM
jgi:hypothetical protein